MFIASVMCVTGSAEFQTFLKRQNLDLSQGCVVFCSCFDSSVSPRCMVHKETQVSR